MQESEDIRNLKRIGNMAVQAQVTEGGYGERLEANPS